MIHFIVNPSSRSGRGQDLWNESVLPYLAEHEIPHHVWFSGGEGDIARCARDICASEDERPIRIALLGGDGSLNELLQGIPHPEDVLLGVLPVGSGNDFARALKLPKRPEEALELIAEGMREERGTALDLGELTYADGETRRFAISCGIGFDAAVCEEALHSNLKAFLNRLRLGKLSYGLISLRQIFTARRAGGTLTLDGGEAVPIRKLLFLTGMNTRYEGGGFPFCPDAAPDDGALDLCLVNRISRLGFFTALPFSLFGKHLIFRGITPYRAKKFEIHLDEPLWIHTDGEVARKEDFFRARVLPGAIRVILPKP